MRVLDRYVVREFLRLFILFAISAPILFVLGDVTDNIDTFMDRQISGPNIVLGYLFQMPEFIFYSFPIAALIATIFTVSNMTRHSEMAAAKAGGVSFYRVLAPLPILGIVLTGLALVISEITPIAGARRAELHGERASRRQARTDFVYRAEGGSVYSIRLLDTERNRIDGLSVHRQGDEVEHPTVAVTAAEATYSADTGWTFHNGYLRYLLGPGKESTMRFDRLRPTRFRETPEQLLAVPKEPEEMRYQELGRFIDIMERSGAKPLKLMVEHSQKIAIPVATLIIILFAAPLANTTSRGGPAYGIGISLGITILYLMLFRLSAAAGATGSLDTTLAAWLPNIIFLGAAGLLLTRVRT
ncbi:MAG TPA: LptF/LptG family permease [Longimicrobiales bacterium]